MTANRKPTANIDFTKVESLRRHMLLTTTDMSKLLGVSRMTYYGYVRGKSPQKNKVTNIRLSLKKLLSVVADYGWPTSEILEMEPTERVERLNEILESLE